MYALTAGSWYRIDKTFVGAVDADVAAIDGSAPTLPDFEHGSEAKYCEAVVENGKTSFALMDRKLIRFGTGRTPVEFCDLFSSSRDIIHVKRYGASSVLSHLLAQGAVSGEAFKSDLSFRARALDFLPKSFHWSEPANAADFRVVFAVVSERKGPLRLPFFTRVNLRQVTRRLQNYGYRVALTKIGVEEVFAKTKKVKPSKKQASHPVVV